MERSPPVTWLAQRSKRMTWVRRATNAGARHSYGNRGAAIRTAPRFVPGERRVNWHVVGQIPAERRSGEEFAAPLAAGHVSGAPSKPG
jgi:hypothetical protein